MSADLTALNLDVENEAQEANDYAPLPPGIYAVAITDSVMKTNKNNAGQHLSLTCEVIEGEFEGRLVWGNLTVQNPNAQAEKIGRGQLTALCKAVGVLNPTDSAELHNKPLKVKVTIRKDDPTRNDVKSFYPIDTKTVDDAGDNTPAAPAPAPAKPAPRAPAPAPKPAAPAAGKKPWQK